MFASYARTSASRPLQRHLVRSMKPSVSAIASSARRVMSVPPRTPFSAMGTANEHGTRSINPYNGEVVAHFDFWTDAEANAAAERSMHAFGTWKTTSFAERGDMLNKAAELLRERREQLVALMAKEMGKPYAEGRGEIDKCAAICEFYASKAEEFLAPELVTEGQATAPLPGSKHYVTFTPLGPILIIMPWNFPFWQVFRQAATALSAGNTMLMKHAPNVFGCARAIEQLMHDAGFAKDVFQNIPISGEQASKLIAHDDIQAVAFTGSTPVGAKVGGIAGGLIKPHVLELGGTDPYLILHDADLEHAVEACAVGRLLNAGQSCVGAKRFISVPEVAEEFETRLAQRFEAVKTGHPSADDTQMGPMVHHQARDHIHRQVTESVAKGAKVLIGGTVPKGPGAFYPATVLSNVTAGMPAYTEEFFGPVAIVIRASSESEAIKIANATSFGLGSSVFTRDLERGERIAAEEMESGLCFVNDFVKSHQALPFGGMKRSGVGRECGSYGIKEFVNIKTVVVGNYRP